MRVVITGATGNVGTSVIRALRVDPQVESILGIARRRPRLQIAKTEWAEADVSSTELAPLFHGADVVVHLAWLIQPARDISTLRATNVKGSARVFEAVAEAKVPSLVYASSVGAYSPGPKDRRVDESWPTEGISSSFYSRHKAEVERLLDDFEGAHPEIRVVRLRPGLIFKRESASEQRRLFAGPFLPSFLMNPRFIPVVPSHPRLRFQAVHGDDVGEAYHLAISKDVRGPFNVAAEPELDGPELGRLLRARPVPVPRALLRGAAALTWHLRLQPSPPGWVDMAFGAPLMEVTRARHELGWLPRYSAGQALLEVFEGMREGAGVDTPPLSSDAGGPFRAREISTGVGGKAH
jgi:UDP-glucose 4-epimerase